MFNSIALFDVRRIGRILIGSILVVGSFAGFGRMMATCFSSQRPWKTAGMKSRSTCRGANRGRGWKNTVTTRTRTGKSIPCCIEQIGNSDCV